MCPFRKDCLTALEEDEQVGRAVVVNVLDRTHTLVRRGVEFLDKVDLVVEVAIRLSAYEYITFVVLVNIRSAIEVGIEGHFAKLALRIVRAPDVGPAVAVPILDTGGAGTWP
jgi:hypothetical protein